MTGNKVNISDLKQSIKSKVPSEIIESAKELNCELYVVGGAVRDCILGLPIKDIDFSVVGDVNALTEDIVKRQGSGKVSFYQRYGTALVQFDGNQFEFATSREESYSPESRKPSQVSSVPIERDLKRRDFTINTLALGIVGSRSGELIDLFDGVDDLKQGIIKTPLEPNKTFSDDPLRMLRAIRFAAELGFYIVPETWEGIKENASRIDIVALERIGDEFLKMVAGSDPVNAIMLLIDSGLMEKFIPEINRLGGVEQVGKHHHKDVLKHTMKVMQNVIDVSSDPILRLSALFHDIGKPRTKRFYPKQGWTFHGHEVVGERMTQKIGRRIHIGKSDLNRLTKLVGLHMRPINLTSEGVTDSAIRRLMVDCSDDIDSQLILCRADITTANPKLVTRYLANFDEIKVRMDKVLAKDKMREFQSPLRGDEIMKICCIEPGPLVGALKGRIEDAILEGEISYDIEAATEYLMKIKDEVLTTDVKKIKQDGIVRSRHRNNISNELSVPEITARIGGD